MNLWLWAAAILLLGLLPAGWACLRTTAMERLVGLQAAGLVVVTLVLVLLAQGYDRASYFDVPLALALLSFASGLSFVRILERWL